MQDNKEVRSYIKLPLSYPVETVMSLLLVAIVFVTFLQVLFRYVFHLSLGWTEELARFIFLWLAAFSIGYAYKVRAHFALRFIVNLFGGRVQKVISTLVYGLTVIFIIFFIWKSIEYVISSADQYGPSTGLSMAVPYSSSVVVGILILVYTTKNWVADFRSTKVLQGG